MGINTTLESASTTAASNGPSGSDQRTIADDALRQYLAFIKSLKTLATLASNTTVTPPSTANAFSVTGTTAITTIASTNSWDGRDILFVFAGILTFTHGSNLILPGSANITTAVGDAAWLVQVASGQWRCVGYSRADGSIPFPQTNLTLTGNLVVNGNTTLGNASGDTLTIHPDAITWQNDPTHSANHTFSGNTTFTGNATVNGNTTLGNAGTDTVTTNGNVTLNAPSSGATINVNTGGQGIKITTSVARGGGLSFLDFYDPTGAKGEIGFGAATDDMYITNILSGNLFLGTLNITGLTITSDRRVYGTALHNNAGAVTGTTNQYIASGTYQPAPTAITNVSAVSAASSNSGIWIRVGNVVQVICSFDVDPTAGGATSFRFSLPIASTVSSSEFVSGVGQAQGNSTSPMTGQVSANTGNNQAQLDFVAGTDLVSRRWSLTFSYLIL